MTSRGTANVLTRATAFLAAGFFLTSLVLSILAGYERRPTSILNTGAPGSPSAPASGEPAAPLGQGGRGVLDTLRQQSEPAAPTQPQVPRSQ
jgi:preprotein translocase subunit SecG